MGVTGNGFPLTQMPLVLESWMRQPLPSLRMMACSREIIPGLRELSNTKSTLALSRPIEYEVLLLAFKISCLRAWPLLLSRKLRVAAFGVGRNRLQSLPPASSSPSLSRLRNTRQLLVGRDRRHDERVTGRVNRNHPIVCT